MEHSFRAVLFLIILLGTSEVRATSSCDVESQACTCVMPKFYDCPVVNLTLRPTSDGCLLLKNDLTNQTFSNITCGENDPYMPTSNGVSFEGGNGNDNGGGSLIFQKLGCDSEFYFIVDLNGGQLVKKVMLEALDSANYSMVRFEFAYGYTVPCNDQPTVNTLLWQYVTPPPESYPPGANISDVWNRLQFDGNTYVHTEPEYFRGAYLFIHFTDVPEGARFKLQLKGCVEDAKEIDESLIYLTNLEIKTERELQQGPWKINEERRVKRTFVRVEPK